MYPKTREGTQNQVSVILSAPKPPLHSWKVGTDAPLPRWLKRLEMDVKITTLPSLPRRERARGREGGREGRRRREKDRD